jgi:hypothetical protein
VQIVTETPDGVAAACANHARNAAVTSCTRCGLFICALCDMNVGEGSVCPSCFQRGREQNALGGAPTRYRDYATMSISGAVLGLLCSILPVGPFVIWWGVKGIRQRRSEGAGITGVVVAICLGVLETLGMLTWYGLMIFAMMKAGTT